jgi:hypothetical protein
MTGYSASSAINTWLRARRSKVSIARCSVDGATAPASQPCNSAARAATPRACGDAASDAGTPLVNAA